MALSQLKAHFNARTERYKVTGEFGNVELIRTTVKALQHKFGVTAGRPSVDRLKAILTIVKRDGIASAAEKDLKHLCWALREPQPDAPALMYSSEMINQIGRILANPDQVVPKSAYRGLLDAYFSYRPERLKEDDVRAAWRGIRLILQDNLPKLWGAENVVNWLRVVRDHDNLISSNPCSRYAKLAKSQMADELEFLRVTLGISEESWFWESLLMAQVREVCALDGSSLSQGINEILPTVSSRPVLFDRALRDLLTRYFEANIDEPHAELKDVAVGRWGSPNLQRQASWDLVSADVKQMVQEWVVLEDLKDFFEVLKDGKNVDRRRLNYWVRFLKQISFARIALGPSAYNNPSRDFKDLREKRKNRVAELLGSSRSNNVFVMKIGSYVFVEYSETGNAAYGYAADNVPFKYDASVIDFRSSKNVDLTKFRETHATDWESKFDNALRRLGIFPDGVAQGAQRFDDARFRLFCNERKLTVDDLRDRGGSLWVRYVREDDSIGLHLKQIGFRFAREKGWWRK